MSPWEGYLRALEVWEHLVAQRPAPGDLLVIEEAILQLRPYSAR